MRIRCINKWMWRNGYRNITGLWHLWLFLYRSARFYLQNQHKLPFFKGIENERRQRSLFHWNKLKRAINRKGTADARVDRLSWYTCYTRAELCPIITLSQIFTANNWKKTEYLISPSSIYYSVSRLSEPSNDSLSSYIIWKNTMENFSAHQRMFYLITITLASLRSFNMIHSNIG